MTTKKGFSICLAVTTLILVLGAESAIADDQEQGGLGEIVVTAQRREQNLIDVPAAVSAISGQTLGDVGVVNLPAVSQQVPNFNVQYDRGENGTPTFELRGIAGDGLQSRFNESSIAVYSDDVFIGDETLINLMMFDTDRVEVLRGPQGTLFGKNTTGGLVQFVSNKPTEQLTGYADVETGSAYKRAFDAAISGALTDRVRVRLAARYDRDDGPYKNYYVGAGEAGVPKTLGDTDLWGIRGIVDIDVTDKTLLRLTASYGQNDSQPAPGYSFGALLPGSTGFGPYTANQLCSQKQAFAGQCIGFNQLVGGLPVVGSSPGRGIDDLPDSENKERGYLGTFTAALMHDFGPVHLTSITNYTEGSYLIAFDGDGGLSPSVPTGLLYNFPAEYKNQSHQFSEEIRFDGSVQSLDWVGGAFYYNDHKENYQIVNFDTFGFAQTETGAVNTQSYALFGQGDYHLSNQFILTVGARVTNERRQLVDATAVSTGTVAIPEQDILAAVAQPHTNNTNVTPKLSFSWKPTADDNYYVSYSRGIKSPGYNDGFDPTQSVAVNAKTAGPVGEEKVDSYEIGSKNRFLDRRFSVNSAIFFAKYTNKQESVSTFNGLTTSNNYINVGNAQIFGVESEIKFRPDDHWDLSVAGGWDHTKITESDVVIVNGYGVPGSLYGTRLPNAPEWNVYTVLGYHFPAQQLGEFTPQAEVRGVASQFYSTTPGVGSYSDGSHVFTNFRLLWISGNQKYNAQAYVTNAFNENSFIRLQGADNVYGGYSDALGVGRLWGVKFGVHF